MKNYYTYGIINPDGMKYKKDIVKMILSTGLKIDYYKCDVKNDGLKSSPVLKMLIYDLDGNAEEKYKSVMGVSATSNDNTIRGCYGDVISGASSTKEVNNEILQLFGSEIDNVLINVRSNGKIDEMVRTINESECFSNLFKDFDEIGIKTNEIDKFCDDYAKKMEL